MIREDYLDSIKSCYSTWSQNYYQDYYGENALYPPIHRDLLRQLLLSTNAKNVLDVGCGPASFLRELVNDRIELYGFDLTPEMVAEAQKVLAKSGIPSDRIWQGSILNPLSFKISGEKESLPFDAAICIGVFPHIPESEDINAITNLRDSVKEGGIVAIEARNQLFSLFTLNRYSYEFLSQDLIQLDALSRSAGDEAQVLEENINELKQFFRMDLPPLRKGKQDEPGYDEVLSRLHNPLVLKEQFAEVGFKNVRVLFYHYHCLPPLLEAQMPEFFRENSLAMENPTDWRGYFMASAFIVVGRKA
ncbi:MULTISPECIES: class I SAM-dependent methyltransferase [Spirulina sp. CCY15215]|uniref:class I SAM-dependent methyltransferase n=1 Tax=Spirulina sp. CCY15215 TaxID=2767591 RepID=UPI00194E2DB6